MDDGAIQPTRRTWAPLPRTPCGLWLAVAGLIAVILTGATLVPGQAWSQTESSTREPAQVWTLSVQGAIGPASSDLIIRSLADAQTASADLFVLILNTPGGLDKAMRDIIQAILASPVPVVTYVAPQGSRAASAGTYILYASHVAAMAPATNLGSATPVAIGGPGAQPQNPAPSPGDEADDPNAQPDTGDPDKRSSPKDRPDQLSTMERKQINDAVAYIRGLADLRARNADWAESAVRDATNIEANEALRLNVIDLVASDMDDLLAQLDGREVTLNGETRRLALQPYALNALEPDWRSQFLAVITDPSVAYILMLIGIYGLILEFYNPGMGFPGILGGICLLLGLYALQMLPVSYVGLGLILLGLALMVAEAFAPSFGVLGLGGAAAFVMGSVLLMDTDLPAFQIAWQVIAAVTLVSVLVLTVVLHLALKARRHRVVTGMEAMVGSTAEALEDFDQIGRVRTQGETWQARSNKPVRRGERVRIIAVDGLTLQVETDS